MKLFSRTTATDNTAAKSLPLFFSISVQDQMLFAKRLAILLKAGVPILEAITMMQEQSTSRSWTFALRDLAEGVAHGQFLHRRLELYRKYFGDFAINIIRVGEISGNLHQNLLYLADSLKKKRELQKKVIGALIYPFIVVIATFGITIMLIVYIFPKILPILQSVKGNLPISTRLLIWLSHLLSTHGYLLLLGLVVVVVGSIVLMKIERVARIVDTVLLKLPLIGNLFLAYQMANFCRTLSMLLKSNIAISEAAIITARTATNKAYQKALLNLSEHIVKGEKISDYFKNNTSLFPPMLRQMVSVGESTGNLSDTLLFLAEVYESEVDELTKNLSNSIEPVLMVVMGVLVGFIAISIITPIYSLTQSLTIH